MSNVNYSLNNRGVRLVTPEEAWCVSKSGKRYLNPKYKMVGKLQISMPSLISNPTVNKKPRYKGDVCDLNRTAKNQIFDYFYNDEGKRNAKRVAYFGIEKQTDKSNSKKGGK